MDRYMVGSDAVGLTQGFYDTRTLPLFKFLNGDRHAPKYLIADHFFQGAFGGSFLNHQWLISAQTPKFEGRTPSGGGANDLRSIVGTDGHPNNTDPLHSGPVWPAPGGVKDGALTEAADASGNCAPPAGAPTPPPGTVCGDRPAGGAAAGGLVRQAGRRGERAPGLHQRHRGRPAPGGPHQGDPGRQARLVLDPGGDHLRRVRRPVGPRAAADRPGRLGRLGPGTRIPAMLLSDRLPQRAAVDHTEYDTVSILSTIEQRFHLDSLFEPRRG
jgi:hypothetical protein